MQNPNPAKAVNEMSRSQIESPRNLRIGSVEYVAPDNIRVAVDVDAPESIALNSGSPRPFPRVNSYLVIPVDDLAIVGQIEWITIEHSPFPKRKGMQDFGLVDLPYPLRKLRINPLGTLRHGDPQGHQVFRRGAEVLPTVGATVNIPSTEQLLAIAESGQFRRLAIGVNPLAEDAPVHVDPDKLFGRHLAILGNTGSGKSCSVAGLIRWSIEHAQAHTCGRPNARFIVLDPNGEYARAFQVEDSIRAKVFAVGNKDNCTPLKVPIWFWNDAEWAAFAHASPGTQRPTLRRALREVKAGAEIAATTPQEFKLIALRMYLSSRMTSIRADLRYGRTQTDSSNFGFRLKAIADDLAAKGVEFPEGMLGDIVNEINAARDKYFNSFVNPQGETVEHYRAFNEESVQSIVGAFERSLAQIGGVVYQGGPREDTPIPFSGAHLADHIEDIANQENTTRYLDFLIARIRTLLSDPTLRSIVDDGDSDTSLLEWLDTYIGADTQDHHSISIVDLSLVPSEIVHLVTAVVARMTFEALQRHVKQKEVSLPTVLVMEEAHQFIKSYREVQEFQDASTVCCRVFERIAREGRKFGLGLILSSQRPSELSPAVLSQCNTFLLHRISNDRDQGLLTQLVPDNFRGLLRELPSLPSQNAILLGWATELPRIGENARPRKRAPTPV